MANFGCKCAIAFWVISIIAHICYVCGISSWNFLSVWGVVSIVEKSLKMVSQETEQKFYVWASNGWDSLTGRNPPIGHLRP